MERKRERESDWVEWQINQRHLCDVVHCWMNVL